jgi:hypothetical protein
MENGSNERLSDRLKGALILVAIVFALLVVSGGPDGTSAGTQEVYPPIVTTPGNPSWDF